MAHVAIKNLICVFTNFEWQFTMINLMGYIDGLVLFIAEKKGKSMEIPYRWLINRHENRRLTQAVKSGGDQRGRMVAMLHRWVRLGLGDY